MATFRSVGALAHARISSSVRPQPTHKSSGSSVQRRTQGLGGASAAASEAPSSGRSGQSHCPSACVIRAQLTSTCDESYLLLVEVRLTAVHCRVDTKDAP